MVGKYTFLHKIQVEFVYKYGHNIIYNERVVPNQRVEKFMWYKMFHDTGYFNAAMANILSCSQSQVIKQRENMF